MTAPHPTHTPRRLRARLWALLLMCLMPWALALASDAWRAPRWVPLNAQWARVEGVADQSALNHPINPADALAVSGSHFMAMGPDGVAGTADDTRVRLFGINLGRDACFPPPEKAAEVAATLRSLGFNAVRLHQMDAAPTDGADVFQSSLTLGPYPTLHEGAMNRLRHFISALKTEGLYVNLNLMVGYVFRPGVDGVPALDPQGTPPGYGSPVHVFYPKMVALQTEHAQKLLAALRLKDEPALAQVEIINESSLAAAWLHWDKTHWEKQIRGDYATELDKQWQQWVTDNHGSMDAACAKWGTCGHESGQMPTPAQADALQHALSADWWVRLKQKWGHWMALLRQTFGLKATAHRSEADVHPKVLDALKFVADTDRRFLEHMRAVVQTATRPTLPVTGTQMDFGAPLNFRSHQRMDYVDAHFYVDHPVFPGVPWSDTDWHFHNETVSGQEIGQLLSLATFRDPSKPFVVSEFNQPYPNTHGHDILPVTAAFAAQQDWDGLYFFAYGGTDENPNVPAHFFLQGDWAKASLVGLSARLFRTASVAPLPPHAIPTQPSQWWAAAAHERRPDTWARHLTHQQLFSNDLALNHAVSLSVVPNAAPFSAPPSASSSAEPTAAQTAQGSPALKHLAGERRVTLETPTVQGLLGEVAARTPTRVGGITVQVETVEARARTAVVLQSLDGLPVATSRHLLLATPAPLTGTHHASAPPRPQRRIPYREEAGKWTLEPALPHTDQPSSPRSAMAPIWLDQQQLTVTLATPHTRAEVYPLTTQGRRMPALPAAATRITAAGLVLQLGTPQSPVALWHEVVFP